MVVRQIFSAGEVRGAVDERDAKASADSVLTLTECLAHQIFRYRGTYQVMEAS